MRILITGAKGQLGSEFVKRFEKEDKDFLALGHTELDITDLKRVLEVFEEYKPDVVINCSAYNLVDKAEEERVNAIKVNAIGPKNLAFACEKHNSSLVHFSSDYVFDGKKEGLYVEDDIPNPLNVYGESKLLGEEFIKEETKRFLILRTSWVYGEGKQNFIYKLLSWAKEKEYIKVACDEFSVPTYTGRIVEITLQSIKNGLSGIFHLTNSGYTSRFEWAKVIFKSLNIKKFIYPTYMDEFNSPAKRPRFSAMSNEKIKKILDVEIPDWEKELVRYLKGDSSL
ncbi:MAG: dTDP-4-dehydrorhamnose reductase [Dictyoglomaceae bacterium]